MALLRRGGDTTLGDASAVIQDHGGKQAADCRERHPVSGAALSPLTSMSQVETIGVNPPKTAVARL